MQFGQNKIMEFSETKLKGSFIIETNPLKDSRGFFDLLFCEDELKEVGFKKKIVQVNRSFTNGKGTVRGLHYQNVPYTETKIIRCVKGAVFDIIVDVRKKSKTFLQWFAVELNSENDKMIYIPDGFAHGFQTLEENTELLYFHTAFYNKEAEGALNILDKKLNIKLPLNISEISKRDKNHKFIDNNFEGIKI